MPYRYTAGASLQQIEWVVVDDGSTNTQTLRELQLLNQTAGTGLYLRIISLRTGKSHGPSRAPWHDLLVLLHLSAVIPSLFLCRSSHGQAYLQLAM
eukprot:scaffold1470_cov384-Prasinococcus_capsulatus_cf.AAC.5